MKFRKNNVKNWWHSKVYYGLYLLAVSSFAQAGAMEFAVIGDMPYNAKQKNEFENLIKDMNSRNLAFVVHVGDYWFDGIAWKNDSKGLPPCSDEVFDDRLKMSQTIRHSLIITPGDNDWTDCYRAKPKAYDPLERLQKLRRLYFKGDESLGQHKIKLIRQSKNKKYSKFVENVRWNYEGVDFATLHMVGSNNNLGRTAEMDKEFEIRNTANIAWIDEVFDQAKKKGSKGIIFFAQANPGFETTWSGKLQKRYLLGSLKLDPPKDKIATGFDEFLQIMEERTIEFGKPVVYVHGDTHTFRIDKPLVRSPQGSRFIENFTRVETFGFPNTHWIKVTIDPDDPNLFRFSPQIVEANKVKM